MMRKTNIPKIINAAGVRFKDYFLWMHIKAQLFAQKDDVRAIEQQPYIEYESRLQEIGKMLGGWMRQTQSSPFK